MNAETSRVEESNRASDPGDTRGCEATLKKKYFMKTTEGRDQTLKLGKKKKKSCFSKCRKANFM